MRTVTPLVALVAAILAMILFSSPASAFLGCDCDNAVRGQVENSSVPVDCVRSHRDQGTGYTWWIDTIVHGGSSWEEEVWAVFAVQFNHLPSGDLPEISATMVPWSKSRGRTFSLPMMLDWPDRAWPIEMQLAVIPIREWSPEALENAHWRTRQYYRIERYAEIRARLTRSPGAEGSIIVVRIMHNVVGAEWRYAAIHIRA